MTDTPRPVPRWPRDEPPSGGRKVAGHRRAITIIEVLIVGAIVVTVSAIGLPAYTRYRINADTARTMVDIRTLEKDIYTHEGDNGKLPDFLEEVRFYTPLDPWKTPYQYLNTSTKKGKAKARWDKLFKPLNTDFDLYSMGPDRDTQENLDKKESLDDIVRALNGQYVGLASEY
jgi:general secretion pathway protein G